MLIVVLIVLGLMGVALFLLYRAENKYKPTNGAAELEGFEEDDFIAPKENESSIVVGNNIRGEITDVCTDTTDYSSKPKTAIETKEEKEPEITPEEKEVFVKYYEEVKKRGDI